ncbi:MAG: hypothetical protein HQM09_00100 [Candidatus Riflebacteria bacterium]|nr:hypothetical protein [Candidatus Riflebacteria bacterium]
MKARLLVAISIFFAFALLVTPFKALSADFLTSLFGEHNSASGEIKPAPWSGDWWSRKKGFNIKGWPGHTPSPFERYDQYVLGRTGQNPGATAWESDPANTHYGPQSEDWEGHCNGWSGASVLEPEPHETKIRNGISFETSDQKAILSELYMNTYCMFYGKRNWGNHGDDPLDIYPDQFHKLLLEYIAGQKSAVVCDITPDRQVWNYPLYKFESSWQPSFLNDKKLKVRTVCTYADDGVKPDYHGTKSMTITYTYNLIIDDQGNIVSGEWTGDSVQNHPDFVWVPTADAPNPPGTVQENPNLDTRFVHEITNGAAVVQVNPEALLSEAGLNTADLF